MPASQQPGTCHQGQYRGHANAGGILSAGVDGIKVAEAVARSLS